MAVVSKDDNSRFNWSLVVVHTSIPLNLSMGNLIFALVFDDYNGEMR